MEFYKITEKPAQTSGVTGIFQLEEEKGQDGCFLDNGSLSRMAQILYSCYQVQEVLPLNFRKYLMAYYNSGVTEYVALAEASCLADRPLMDGFASTWLEGEEENRVWIGADGAVENRGPSAEKVKYVLDLLITAFQNGENRVVF